MIFRRFPFLAFPLLIALFGSAFAQNAEAPADAPAATMSEMEIRRDVTNATISGRYTFGGFFTEYHAADGRVLGHNGWTKNTDACWTTKAPNQICYSYGATDDRQTYCFVMERSGDALTLRTAEDNRLNGVAKLETGNVKNHSDGGNPWNCDAIISSMPPRDRWAALK
jgi:hypothetical protein